MKENIETQIKYFEDLYNIEKEARDLYLEILSHSRDEKNNKKIEKIMKQEEKHMKIVRDIIDIIKSN